MQVDVCQNSKTNMQVWVSENPFLADIKCRSIPGRHFLSYAPNIGDDADLSTGLSICVNALSGHGKQRRDRVDRHPVTPCWTSLRCTQWEEISHTTLLFCPHVMEGGITCRLSQPQNAASQKKRNAFPLRVQHKLASDEFMGGFLNL